MATPQWFSCWCWYDDDDDDSGDDGVGDGDNSVAYAYFMKVSFVVKVLWKALY